METLTEEAPVTDHLAHLEDIRRRWADLETERAAAIRAARDQGHLTFRAIGGAVGLSHSHASNLHKQGRA